MEEVRRKRDCNSVVIVKLGGSCITDKDTFETLKEKIVEGTAAQIKDIFDSQKLILIHGAGSFGHFTAKEYQLSKGGLEQTWRLGLALTRQSVTTLNKLLLVSLTLPPISLPAVSVSLFPCTTTKLLGKHIKRPGALHSVIELVNNGFLPLLHGDVLLDEDNRCSIYSGDTLMQWLCTQFTTSSDEDHLSQTLSFNNHKSDTKLRVAAAVFLTDVPGIFDRPPNKPGARLLRCIYVDPVQNSTDSGNEESGLVDVEMNVRAHDVTGGIKGKLAAASAIARLGIPVYIVQAGTSHAAQAMRGLPPAVGTLVVLRDKVDGSGLT
jgi:isopentenyl phosphate kinase